jgi:hypothetical protein
VRPADVTKHLEHICKHQSSIWTCAGCDTVTFEWQLMYPGLEVSTRELREEDWDEHDGGYFSSRLPTKLFRTLNPVLATLYTDVVASFGEGRLLLCTIGLRTLIEGICAEKGITDAYSRDLKVKVNALATFVPNQNIIEALDRMRELGNDAVHRLEALNQDDAKLAIELVEDLLNFLFELDYKASQVRNTYRKAGLSSTKAGSVQ